MTGKTKTFDVQATLSLLQTGAIKLPAAPDVPADRQACVNPDCDGGFIVVAPASGLYDEVRSPCPECQARTAKRVSRAHLMAAGLSGTIYEANWDDLDLSHESWQVAREYALDADELVRAGQSLIFVGDYGRGKTQAATLILAHAAQAGHHVERVKWGQFTRRIRGTYTKDSKLTEDALISALVVPDLVLLDDVGAADKHSEHNERLLTSVIDERYDQGKAVILTTNLGRADLEEHLGGRAFSRLWNNADTVVFDGPNYRELREKPQARNLAARIRQRVQNRQQAAN